MHRAAAVLVLFAAAAPSAAQSPPLLLHVQGRLLDGDDHPVNGSTRLTFRLFPSDSSGAVAFWSEEYTVSLAGGVYDVTLGDTAANTKDPLPASLLTQAEVWMSIQVNDDAEMTPRLKFGSTMWALHAGDAASLGGKAADEYALDADLDDLDAAMGTLDGRVDALETDVAALQGSAKLSGAIFTGPVTLAAAPAADLQAATKKYVDDTVAAATPTGYAQLSGAAFTGAVTLAADPTADAQAANKHYVDANFAPRANPVFTGSVTLPGDPSLANQAATKNYVDTKVPSGSPTFDALTVNGAASVGGSLRIGNADNVSCDSGHAGVLRYANQKLEICATSAWVLVASTVPPVMLTTVSGARRWSDATYAKSCKEYRNPVAPYTYQGDIGSGTYAIKPSTSVINVYCDMAADGGGWTLVYKVKSSSSDVSNWFSYLGSTTDVAMNAPTGTPSGWQEGLSSANRASLWSQSGATTYRMTAYGSNDAMFTDVKKESNFDTGNASYCAASGCTGVNGYSNAVAGTVTVLGGTQGTPGQAINLYQLGYWSCNCSEGQYLYDHPNSGGYKLFGDYANTPAVAYTSFWIR